VGSRGCQFDVVIAGWHTIPKFPRKKKFRRRLDISAISQHPESCFPMTPSNIGTTIHAQRAIRGCRRESRKAVSASSVSIRQSCAKASKANGGVEERIPHARIPPLPRRPQQESRWQEDMRMLVRIEV